MERFQGGFVLLLIFHCSLSLAVEELKYNKLGDLEFGCPIGWKAYETNCYFWVNFSMEFEDAEKTCESFEANPLQIEDDIENKQIAEFAKSASWTRFWNGQKYKDSTKCAGIWDDYQPPNNTKDGACISVNKNGWWKVTGCQELLPFICKKPACINGTSYCGKDKCINTKWFCDGVNDCTNNLDEMNCEDRCSYYKTGDTGTITQGHYKANADCFWTIEGPVGTQLKLTFTKIMTEEDRDVVEVWGGSKSMSNSVKLKMLSGDLDNSIVYSFNNFVIIRFRSDAKREFSGFEVTWTSAVPELSRTVKEITASDGWQDLSSPFYPKTPPYGFSRKWVITTDADSILTLEIVDIDLKSTWELSIYDGDSYMEDPVKITKSSDSRSPAVYISSGNKLRVNLKGTNIVSGKGIKMRVKKGCNVQIQQEWGEIFSPGYLKTKYPTSIDCSWTLKAPDSNKQPILLKLVEFSLADDKDIIKVYNGADANSPAIHEGDGFKGDLTSEKKTVSGGDTIYLTFSSSLIQATGRFKIEFSIDCPTIPSSAKMTLSSNLTKYESEVTVTCEEGYSFVQEEFYLKDSLLLSCLKGGKWNITRYPTCQIIYCGVPKPIDNGFIANYSGSVKYEGEATYKCYPGFKMENSAKVKCLKTGEWQAGPTCKTSTCSAAAVVSKAEKTTVIGDGTSSGSIVKYNCSDGYELLGPLQILCKSDGNWSHTAPTCTKIMCPLPKIMNGNFSSSKPVAFDKTVTLTCQTGYETQKSTLKCLASGQLETSSCEDKNECNTTENNCSEDSQKCVNTIGSFYCDCKDGYEKSDTSCIDIDECNNNNGGCSQQCNNTAPLYSCSCNEGYVMFTANNTKNRLIPDGETGLKQGDVYHINHTCVPVICSRPADVDNGTIHSKRSIFYFKDTIEFSCLLGWKLSGPSSRTCQSDETWNGTRPVCEAVTCDPLEITGTEVQKSRVQNIFPNSSVLFGDEVKLECLLEDGSRINKTLYCEYDNQTKTYTLQGDSPQCSVVDCGQPMLISGAKQPSVSDTTEGNTFTFECTTGVSRTGLSSDGNESIVTCKTNGRWGYGNLTCKVERCSDPGTPGGGEQIVDGYEGGHFVSYNCTRDGYTPHPPEPIFCIISSNGTAAWNGTMPRCKDTTPPEFVNCSGSDIVIDSLQAPGFAVPNAIDNSGYVEISVSPDNFNPQKPVKAAIKLTYTAKDAEGNTKECIIQILLKDRVFPNLTCPDFLKLNITDKESHDIDLTQYITSTSPLQNVPTMTVNFSSYGQTRDIRVSTKSDTGMTSVCAFQVEIAATKCFSEIQNNLSNADVSHVTNDDGTIDSTTVTCKQGYAFSDGNTSLKYSCTGENKWTPTLPLKDCFAYEEAIFTYTFNVLYGSSGLLSNSCQAEHEAHLKTFINSPENHLNKDLCKKDIAHFFAFNTLSVHTKRYLFKLNTTIVINVVNYDGNYFTALNGVCATNLKQYYTDVFKYPQNISCGVINIKEGIVMLNHGPSCNSGLQLVTVAGVEKCFPCSARTYSSNGKCFDCADGKYQNETGKTSCKSCPNNKASLVPRISLNQCINRCIDGFYSTSGLPPCTACAVDTYWKNSTFCEACPDDGSTMSVEGAKNISECKAACQPGSYSVTGYEPCSKCPKNFYATSSTAKKQTSCSECPSASFTADDGNTELNACNNASSCTTTSCSEKGTCEMVNHGPFCTCKSGFTGANCSERTDFCSSHPCENGGTCTSDETGFNCTCESAKECSVSEDGNFFGGITMLDTYNGITLDECKDKCLKSTDCEAAAYRSINIFCALYSKTQVSGKTPDAEYSWLPKTCTHKYYYNGTYCEQDLRNDCKDDSCFEKNMCMDLIGTTKCICPKSGGYSGQSCEKKTDLCNPDPCENGKCVPFGDVRYECECHAGYTGTNCETNINECDMNPSGCLYGGQCKDGVNKYTCQCVSGFSGDHCEIQNNFCKSDECSNGLCLNDYSTNKPVCICEDPYENNAMGSCKQVDHCKPNTCTTNNTAECTSSLDGFTCKCTSGYEGSLCQHSKDDCVSNPCKHGSCTDGLNTYSCACEDGWEGTNCDENINDCQNMCHEANTDNCTDLFKDYMCYCKTGYTGKNCSDEIDECKSLPCQHGATCTDLPADFKCNCTEGWDGKTCADPYNYCDENTTCSNNGTCYSIKDTFYCRCEAGTQGQRCETSPAVCNLINPCTDQGKCDESGGTAQCTCNKNYTGKSCSLIEDSCSNNPCDNNGMCVTKDIGYDCNCADGFQGDQCKEENPVCPSGACSTLQICEKEGGQKYCLCPAKQVSVGASCKDGSLDFDLWFDKDIESDAVMSGEPFKLKSNGNITVMFCIGLLTNATEGTVFKIRNNLDSETFLEVKTGGVSFKESADISMKLPSGQWNHVAITWKSDGNYELIINGVKTSGTNSTPGFQDRLVRLEFDKQFSGYVSQLTVWRDVLSYTEILKSTENPKHLPAFDLALGWYDYHLTKAAWQLTPSLAKSEKKLCDAGRVMDFSCTNKMDKSVPDIVGCPSTALNKVSDERTVEVNSFVPAITCNDGGTIKNSLTSDLFTWGAYQVVYASTDEAGNIADCRFKVYVKKQDCDSSSYSQVEFCNSEGIQGFCPSGEKPAIPWPNIINCGVLGSYNRYNPFEKPVQPTCGVTADQKVTVTLEITYGMAIKCSSSKKDLLVDKVKSAFTTLEKNWSGLTRKLKVSGSCSTSTTENILIKAEFPGLSSIINNLPPLEIIKRAVLENNLLQGSGFEAIAGAKPLKNEAKFNLFASCDSETYVVLGNDCVQCGKGSFFNPTSKKCTLCPIGTYSASAGKKNSCENCDSGKTTLRKGSQASTDCVYKCLAGQYSNNSVCSDCPRDYYQSEEGKDYCRPCPLGKRTKDEKTNSSEKCFDDCPSGTELSEYGNCTDCSQGFYRTQGQQDSCTKCFNRTTFGSKTISEKECNLPDCPEGTYINTTESASCVSCPYGQYQPMKWKFTCIKCNESYTTESEKSKSAEDCKFYCEDGYEEESAENKTCRLCSRGTYRSNNGDERFKACQKCEQNKTTDGEGAKTSNNCSIPICTAGEIITNNKCTACEIDSYQPDSLPNSSTECKKCDDGFGTKMENSTSKDDCKSVCPEGKQFSTTSKSCELCPQGYWKNGNSTMRFEQCEQCRENFTTESEGSTHSNNCSIRDCPAGTKISGDNCEQCPFGYYQDLPRQSNCIECGKNLNTSSTGSTNKSDCTISCAAGYEGPTGKCERCKDDFVKDFSGNGKCIQCTENQTSDVNHTSCTGEVYCANGVGYNTTTKSCQLCAVGTYKSTRGNKPCEDCHGNYTTTSSGSTSVSDCKILHCVPGFYGSSDSCIPCAVGSYKSNDGTDNCTLCSENKTTTSQASTAESDCSIVVCRAGYYRNNSNKCQACDVGQYQSKRGMTSCTPCKGDNFTTENEGSTGEDQCLKVCKKGEYREKRDKCAVCPLGFYQPNEGQAKCLNCSSDDPYTTVNTGSLSPDQCLRVCGKGSYRPQNDRTKCVECEIGKYQSKSGETTCKSCTDGKTTLETGSSSEELCMPICPAGKYLNTAKRTCDLCEMGKYKNTTGTKEKCDSCPEKTTTLSEGSTSKEDCKLADCQPGSYRKANEMECSECPLNYYQDEKSQTSCKQCPSDKPITLIKGAKSEERCTLDCQSGEEFIGIKGSIKCEKCAVGEYRVKEESKKCLVCPKGQTTTKIGSTKCVDSIEKPKPVGRVSIQMKFKFTVTNCGNINQVLGVMRLFIEKIVLDICSSWTTSCKFKVVFSSFCKQRRRRKRAESPDATLVVDDVPEVLTKYGRSAKGVFTDSFASDAQPDVQTLDNNGISFDGLTEVTSSKTCSIGSILEKDKCVMCEAGTKFINLTSCNPCESGTYQDKPGQSTCKPCPGIKSPSSNRTYCISKCNAEPNYCQNGGTCVDLSDSEVSCECSSQYFGAVCENRADLSSEGQLQDILGGAIGGGAVFLLLILLIFGFVGWKRRHLNEKNKKYATSYTSEPPPFMSAVQPMPFYSNRSRYLNPMYDDTEPFDVYDPMGDGTFQSQYHGLRIKDTFNPTERETTLPSIHRSIIGHSTSKRQDAFFDADDFSPSEQDTNLKQSVYSPNRGYGDFSPAEQQSVYRPNSGYRANKRQETFFDQD